MTEIQPNELVLHAWMSDNDPHTFATMLKLIEECGELISRSARSLMAGFDYIDDDSKRTNRAEMVRELSDVTACMIQVNTRLHIVMDVEHMSGKLRGFDHWHNLIDEELAKKNGREINSPIENPS